MSNSLQPHGLQHTASMSITNSWNLLKLMYVGKWCNSTISSSVIPFFSYLQSFPASGFFQWVSSSHQVAREMELQFHHQSFQWILGLISFKIVWFYLLSVQGTLKSLLQHQSPKASILQCSAFFIVQLSHPWSSLVAQLVRNLPAMWETWVPSLGWDPLEKRKATHSSILAWRIPWTIQYMGSQRVGHDWATFTFFFLSFIFIGV